MLLSTPTIGHSASPRTKPLGLVGQQAWFPQLSGPFDVMTQGHTICCDSSCLEVSTTNWHLPRAWPTTEQQRHLPSASMETEPSAAIAVDLPTIPEGVQGGVRHSLLQGIWWDRSLDSWVFFSQFSHSIVSNSV